MIIHYLELLNATLGVSLIMLVLILLRDFKDDLLKSGIKIRFPSIFFIMGILSLSIKEIYKYGPFERPYNPVIAELLETFYFIFTLIAAFLLLRFKVKTFNRVK